jgi:hypothetical protein
MNIVDCGPDAEDETDCEITEEMIKKMKSECEGNTLSQHIMCPNTFICIKQEWLCGKLIIVLNLNLLINFNILHFIFRWRRW